MLIFSFLTEKYYIIYTHMHVFIHILFHSFNYYFMARANIKQSLNTKFNIN